jgi:hypothetical protein
MFSSAPFQRSIIGDWAPVVAQFRRLIGEGPVSKAQACAIGPNTKLLVVQTVGMVSERKDRCNLSARDHAASFHDFFSG